MENSHISNKLATWSELRYRWVFGKTNVCYKRHRAVLALPIVTQMTIAWTSDTEHQMCRQVKLHRKTVVFFHKFGDATPDTMFWPWLYDCRRNSDDDWSQCQYSDYNNGTMMKPWWTRIEMPRINSYPQRWRFLDDKVSTDIYIYIISQSCTHFFIVMPINDNCNQD